MTARLHRFDWIMFAAIAVLLVLSCLFIYSADSAMIVLSAA
jgi:hypothetical protein